MSEETPAHACFDAVAIVEAIDRVRAVWEANVEPLNQLDGAAGDGDLGLTVRKGCAGVGALLPSLTSEAPAAILLRAGMAFNSAAASTMGALIATACMRMSAAAKGLQCLESDDVRRMAEAAVNGIRARGKAEQGDKTLLDALIPAVSVLSEWPGEAVRHEVAVAMLAAAEIGLQSTIGMTPKKGRAQWVGERASQAPDAGATLVVLLFRAVAGAMPEPTTP